DLTRHARAHSYMNVGHGEMKPLQAIIHNAIKTASTSAVSEYSCKSSDRFWRQKTTTRYGPKPEPLAQIVFHHRLGPIKRVKRSYSKAKEIEVLMLMIHHRIIRNYTKEYRPPNQIESASYLKIPQSTISVWYQEEVQEIHKRRMPS
ncbi:hypothetical protein L211DRAFT_840752, partial [Terfezia boudieri ATCC MYA-4762]